MHVKGRENAREAKEGWGWHLRPRGDGLHCGASEVITRFCLLCCECVEKLPKFLSKGVILFFSYFNTVIP